MSRVKSIRRVFTSPVGIALLYAVVSGIWIVTTDIFFLDEFYSAVESPWKSSLKELILLSLTAFALFFLVNWSRDRIAASREALRARSTELSTLIEASPIAIIVVDENMDITLWNNAAERILGWTQDEVLGNPVWLFVKSDQLAQEDGPAPFTTDPIQNELDSFEHKKGHTVLGNWTAVALTDDDNNPVGVELLITDVSQKVRTRERLRLLEAAVEHAGEMMLITESEPLDEPGPRIVYANKAFERITGYPRSYALGRSPRFLQGKDTSRDTLQTLRSSLESREAVREEVINYRKDGTPYWTQITVAPVRNDAGRCTHFVAVQQDITERKKRERELVEARDKAREMHRVKTSFLKNISHEIRTPLAAILGFAELLLEDSSGEQREFARLVHVSGRRLNRTMNDILVLSRIESNSLKMDPEPILLQDEVSTILQRIDRPSDREHVDIFFESNEKPCYALASRPHLEHMLDNLLNNALKFTPEGRVTVRVGTNEGTCVIQVMDTGIGIDEAFLPKVFDEFVQESAGLSREYAGSGLGLPVVQALAKEMNGSVCMDSNKGKGSTFTLRLPMAY